MSSWFSNIQELAESVQESVQSTLPKIDSDMLEKLTLTTPELTAIRHRLDEEESQKERVRNKLADLLPWETRDPERDLLVDECKEAILALSETKNETFFGPYPMPRLGARTTAADGSDEDNHCDRMDPIKPSLESREKLAKLEPLPPLLQNFDFQAHVGLIERILAEDPKLVETQASISGGGERETVFWQNYLFHCAYTRYEAGLSIDEIWSEMSDEERKKPPTTAPPPEKEDVAPAVTLAPEEDAEETVTFEHEVAAMPQQPAKFDEATLRSDNTDFEMIGDGEEDSSGKIAFNEADYELDELEAEIARELED